MKGCFSLINLQNKFLFYDGEKQKKENDFIIVELINIENDGRKFFVDDLEVQRNGNKLLIPNNDNYSTFNIVCKDKNGRFLWKTNAIMIQYELVHNDENIMSEIEEKLNKIRQGFNVQEVKDEIEKIKTNINNLSNMSNDEDINFLVESFNSLAKSVSEKVSNIEEIVLGYDKKIELLLTEYTNEVSGMISDVDKKVNSIEIPENPFDLDMGDVDVPVGYFVAFEDGIIKKYKFGNKYPFGVVLPSKKIRTRGYCVVRHDGKDISVGTNVIGDENGIASKYSKGYPVIKMIDASHCGILM